MLGVPGIKKAQSFVTKGCAFLIPVGLFACSWLVAACSAKVLAVSSFVSPASTGVTSWLLRQAIAAIPHAVYDGTIDD